MKYLRGSADMLLSVCYCQRYHKLLSDFFLKVMKERCMPLIPYLHRLIRQGQPIFSLRGERHVPLLLEDNILPCAVIIVTCKTKKNDKEEREEKSMQVKIIGVKKSEYGKEGNRKVGFNYCGIKEYTRYERENADCEGHDVIKEFSNTDFGIHPGDVVEFVYEPGFQDRATLVDVRIISMADDPFVNGKTAEKPADAKAEKQKGAS